MRPLILTLVNFIGIRAGLGRETLTVDLAALAGDAAMVALVGPNGVGKSTVLDNLHPYRLQPSRAGGYSPGSFSYYDQVYGPDARKTLEWEFAGVRYKTDLLFKVGGKARKTEAYLFKQVGPLWEPAQIPDGTVSDGKADTYDRIVSHILGSPEMFFSAAFSAQNRRSLHTYTNGEIKGLLSELLGLDDILAKGVLAADRAKEQKIRLDVTRSSLAGVSGKRAELGLAEADLIAVRADFTDATERRTLCRAAVQKTSRIVADMQAEESGNIEIEARRAALTRQAAGANERMAKIREKAIDAERAETARIEVQQRAIAADIESLGRQITAARKQAYDSLAMQSRAGEVEAAQTQLPATRATQADAENALIEARTIDSKAKTLAADIRTLRAELAGIENDGRRMAESCQGLKHRSGLIETVPCAAMEIAGVCPLLRDARDAKATLPTAEADTEAKRAEYKAVELKITIAQSALSDLGDTAAAVASAESTVKSCTNAVSQLESIAALAPAIEAASGVIATAEANTEEWTKAAEEKRLAMTAAEQSLAERLDAIAKEAEQTAASITEELELVTAAMSELPPPADTAALAAAQSAHAAAEQDLSRTEQDVARLTARIGALEERVEQFGRDLAGVDKIEADVAALEEDIAQWTLLAKALGPDGIVALSIDDAGPTLAAYANDLLLACYGPRYTVSIRTQGETAKGDLKETFDIRVFDGESGDEKSIRDMSGGQKVYINEAMTRSIALYQAQMHGRHYECLFSDESDGALDPEKKVQFARMKREVLKIGGYRQEIFISHAEAVQDCADVVINMEGFRV